MVLLLQVEELVNLVGRAASLISPRRIRRWGGAGKEKEEEEEDEQERAGKEEKREEEGFEIQMCLGMVTLNSISRTKSFTQTTSR